MYPPIIFISKTVLHNFILLEIHWRSLLITNPSLIIKQQVKNWEVTFLQQTQRIKINWKSIRRMSRNYPRRTLIFLKRMLKKTDGELYMNSSIRDTSIKITPLKKCFWRDARPLRIPLKIFQRIQNMSSSKYPLNGVYIIMSSRSDVPKKLLMKTKPQNIQPTRKNTRIRLSLKKTVNDQIKGSI